MDADHAPREKASAYILRYGSYCRRSIEFAGASLIALSRIVMGDRRLSVRRLPLAPAVVDVGQPAPCPSLAHTAPAKECPFPRSSLACPAMLGWTHSGPEAEVRTGWAPLAWLAPGEHFTRTFKLIPPTFPSASLAARAWPALGALIDGCTFLRLSAVAPRPCPPDNAGSPLHYPATGRLRRPCMHARGKGRTGRRYLAQDA